MGWFSRFDENQCGLFHEVGVPNLHGLLQSEANAIVPGKRRLCSMSPTSVSRRGKVLLATGSPGGATIINTVLEIITNVMRVQSY
jgi:gamma-glutamyltranspeptidase/glutathione hydrolase